jgi:hypothetical protein
LTAANAEACCAANLRSTLRPQDQALCRSQLNRPVASPPAALGSPPGTKTTDDPNNPSTPGVTDGQNNGFGNGDQNAPGGSLPNNNAENAHPNRADPSKSGN